LSSLLETAIGFSSRTSAQWLADHEEPIRQGSRHRQNAPYQRMQTKDGYLMVGQPARGSGRAVQRHWDARMVRGPAFCDQPSAHAKPRRVAGRDERGADDQDHQRLGRGARSRPPCCAARSTTTRRCSADPQVRHRGLVQYASDRELGEVPLIRTPIRIGESVRVRNVAPKLGQHMPTNRPGPGDTGRISRARRVRVKGTCANTEASRVVHRK
jgi:crotonobetainyl-CoA:carnitine CoA-transferase CaiB-like acyl-CoA transferase